MAGHKVKQFIDIMSPVQITRRFAMKTSRLLLIGMAVLFPALMLAACNGGGSGGSNGEGSVAALTMAENVSVVDAQDPG